MSSSIQIKFLDFNSREFITQLTVDPDQTMSEVKSLLRFQFATASLVAVASAAASVSTHNRSSISPIFSQSILHSTSTEHTIKPPTILTLSAAPFEPVAVAHHNKTFSRQSSHECKRLVPLPSNLSFERWLFESRNSLLPLTEAHEEEAAGHFFASTYNSSQLGCHNLPGGTIAEPCAAGAGDSIETEPVIPLPSKPVLFLDIKTGKPFVPPPAYRSPTKIPREASPAGTVFFTSSSGTRTLSGTVPPSPTSSSCTSSHPCSCSPPRFSDQSSEEGDDDSDKDHRHRHQHHSRRCLTTGKKRPRNKSSKSITSATLTNNVQSGNWRTIEYPREVAAASFHSFSHNLPPLYHRSSARAKAVCNENPISYLNEISQRLNGKSTLHESYKTNSRGRYSCEMSVTLAGVAYIAQSSEKCTSKKSSKKSAADALLRMIPTSLSASL